MTGERGQNRTVNLLIKSQLLCQLSYASTIRLHFRVNVGNSFHHTTSIKGFGARAANFLRQFVRCREVAGDAH